MAALIETGLINDVEDANFTNSVEDKETDFIFEKSRDILIEYLKKLLSWPNETIYFFYF